MINLDCTLLTEANLSKRPARSIIVTGHKIEWLSKVAEKRMGDEFEPISLIFIVAQQLQNEDFSNLKFEQAKKLLNNLIWLNQKIVSIRDEKVQEQVPVYPDLTPVITGLVREHSESFILDLINLNAPKLKKAKILRIFNGVQLFKLKHPKFEEDSEILQHSQKYVLINHRWQLLERLMALNHFSTITHFNDTIFQSIIAYQFLLDSSLDAKYPNINAMNEAVLEYNKFPLNIQAEKKFFEAIVFIKCIFPKIIDQGKMTHEKGIKKIQRPIFLRHERLPYTIFYDQNGNVQKISRLLGQGVCKVAKLYIEMHVGKMSVISTQKAAGNSQDILTELKTMQDCKGLPHIVQFFKFDVFQTKKKKKKVAIQMPYYNFGTLNQKANQLNYSNKVKVTVDILTGVKNLHAEGIIHCDLKMDNIFLEDINSQKNDNNSDERDIIASVGDLGTSYRVTEQNRGLIPRGPSPYIPPEIYPHPLRIECKNFPFKKSYKATFETDAWSLGIMLYELFYSVELTLKYHLVDNESLKRMWCKLNDTVIPEDKTSMEYVIWGLLQVDPSQRMKIDEALEITENELNAIA